MPDKLTRETFEGRVGDAFEATPADGAPLRLVLSDCGSGPYAPSEDWQEELGREPFELIFHAEDGAHAPQQTFQLVHAELGELEVFLVPIGPDERGPRYQAVFS